MNLPDLLPLFEGISRTDIAPEELPTFAACDIPGYIYKLAKDSDGQPVLLIPTDGGDRQPPVALEHLSVTPSVRCRIRRASAPADEDRFTIIQCVRGDMSMHAHFLRAVGSVVLSLGSAPTSSALNGSIATLVNLFRAMAAPPQKTVQGLWAELFVIAESQAPDVLVQHWHALPGEAFDFADGHDRLEVKSSSDRARNHHFRLEQVRAPESTEVRIASLIVQPLAGGRSASELMQLIVSRAASVEVIMALERVVIETLGTDWARAVEQRFDHEVAVESLVYFDARAVPAPSADLPVGVSDVHFRSRLDGVPPIDIGDLAGSSPLFAAAAPRLRRERSR